MEDVKIIKKICENCKKEYKASHSNQKYCSVPCYENLKSKKTLKTCLTCEKPYIPAHQNQKYCSPECYRDYMIVHRRENLKVCEHCGEEYNASTTKQKFCSVTCYRKSIKKTKTKSSRMKRHQINFSDLRVTKTEADLDRLQKATEDYHEIIQGLSSAQPEISLEIPTNKPINIVFPADIHVGNIGCYLKKFREVTDLIGKKPRTYVVSVGDTIDNFLGGWHTEGQYEVIFPPAEQKLVTEEFFRKMKGKIIAMVQGDHEEASHQVDDFDFTEYLCQKLKCAYLGFGGFINLTVGEMKYRLHVRHRYRFNSTLNLTHTVKRMLSQLGDFDVGVVAHNHTTAIEHFELAGKMRVAIRPGSYKKTDRYASKIGFNGSTPRIPFVRLWPKQKIMLAFPDVRLLSVWN